VGGRREIENAGDVANVVAGILRQLRGGNQSHQIDYAFEIRGAGLGEVAAQVLPTQTDRLRQFLRRDRSPGVGDDYIPRGALQRRRESERLWRLAKRLAKPGRERVRMHQVPGGVLVNAFYYKIDKSQSGTARGDGGGCTGGGAAEVFGAGGTCANAAAESRQADRNVAIGE